jgi:hypothetical protein
MNTGEIPERYSARDYGFFADDGRAEKRAGA